MPIHGFSGICRVVMKNPPVNVLERSMLANMRDVAMEAEKNPKIKAFVLASVGAHTAYVVVISLT